MPFVKANGQELNYVMMGEGPAILFIHSLGADITLWRDQFEALTDRYCCIAFDLRGHGGSSYDGAFSVLDLATDLKAGLDEIGIDNCHVLGIAMGGPIALTMAARWPDLVRSLIIAGSFVDMRAPAKGRIEATEKRLMTTQMHDFGLEYAETRLMPKTPRKTYEELAEAIAEVSPEAYIDTLKAIFETEFTEELKAADAPALILCGDEDTVTPEHHSKMIEKGLRGSRLRMIPGAGHLLNLDKPEVFNRMVGEFLDAQSK